MEVVFDGFVYFRKESFEGILKKFHLGEFEGFSLVKVENRKDEGGEVALWTRGVLERERYESEDDVIEKVRAIFVGNTNDTNESLDIDNYTIN